MDPLNIDPSATATDTENIIDLGHVGLNQPEALDSESETETCLAPIIELVPVAQKESEFLPQVEPVLGVKIKEEIESNISTQQHLLIPVVSKNFIVKEEPTEFEDNLPNEYEESDSRGESDADSTDGESVEQNVGTSKEKEKKEPVDKIEELYMFCGVCGKDFSDTRLFIQHCDAEHKDLNVTLICAHCGPKSKHLKNIESLKCHHKYVHRLPAKKCPHCDKIVGPKSYNLHIQKVHLRQGLFVCTECKKVLYTRLGYRDHMEKHFPEKLNFKTCPVCNKSIRQNYLSRHLRYHKRQETFMCEVCGIIMTNRGNFADHQDTHKPVSNMILCDICGKNFKTERVLRKHYTVHRGDAKVKCDVCEQILSTVHALKTHMLIHLEERPYKCRFCGKGFRNGANVKVHQRIHTGERPYQCQICPSAFYGMANLNKHKRKVHCNGKTTNKKFKFNGNPDSTNQVQINIGASGEPGTNFGAYDGLQQALSGTMSGSSAGSAPTCD